MMRTHIESGAAATIAGIPVSRKDASALGIMQVDDEGRVKGFVEKPQTEEELATVRMDPAWIDARGIPSQGRDCLASMGLYIFNKDVMVDLLRNSNHQDFGKEVFPSAINSHKVQVHLFDGYWEDIGTIRAFYEANLALTTQPRPPFSFYDKQFPIYTRHRYLPPSKLQDAQVTDSIVGEGSIVKACSIHHCVLGVRSRIEDEVVLQDTLVMGNDFYESGEERAILRERGGTPMGVGRGTTVKKAILDKNVRIGSNVSIINKDNVEEADRAELGFYIRGGIVVITKNACIPDGMVI